MNHGQHILLQYLDRFATRCPVCHAPLQSLDEPYCPSCSRELTVALATEGHSQAIWTCLAAILGMASGLGFLALFMMAINFNMNATIQPEVVGILSFPIASIPALACVLFWRKRFQLMPKPAQVMILCVVACMGLVWLGYVMSIF